MSSKLKKLLRKDSTYRKYKTILKSSKSMGEFENYVNELENMHKGRYARQLVYKKISTKKIIKAAYQDASYRARCVEIMVQVNKAHRMLSASVEAAHNHISSEYKQHLAGFRTKAERETYITSILQDAYDVISDFERILDMCKLIIEDIDKFSWSTKNVVEAMKLVVQREDRIGLKAQDI